MKTKSYTIKKVEESINYLNDNRLWKDISFISIEDYLWSKNNYQPRVQVKSCYTNKNILIYFKAFEEEITARYTKINDPVHKDSCVEFFVNLFPQKSDKYFNFEFNAIGTNHTGFGALGKRTKLPPEDIQLIDINSTERKPIIGKYGSDNWDLICKIPISLLEKYYELPFNYGDAKGNFYKCGDESKFEHFGVWNNINSNKPNFHVPTFFGDLIFDK